MCVGRGTEAADLRQRQGRADACAIEAFAEALAEDGEAKLARAGRRNGCEAAHEP